MFFAKLIRRQALSELESSSLRRKGMGANSSLRTGAYKPPSKPPSSPPQPSGGKPLHRNRQKRRKPVARLGRLQRLVLRYACKVARSFTPSDIVEKCSLKRRYAYPNKRVYDAIQKLVKKGFLRKIGRGKYELVKDVSPDMLKVEDVESSMGEVMGEVKENLSPRALIARSRSKRRGSGRRTLRIHVMGIEGYLELYESLLLVKPFVDLALRSLERYLISLGVSKYLIRKLKKEYKRLYDPLRIVVGGHGKYCCKSELLTDVCGGFVYEVGVDIVNSFELPKLYMKVYTDTITYDVPLIS